MQYPQSDVPSADELFRLLMENVRDYAIFTVSPQQHITTWNEGAERILGYRAEEVIGQSASLIFTQEDQALGAVDVEFMRAQETGRAENERWHVKKDSSLFWCSGIITALRAEDGNLRGFVKIMRDTTERKQHQDNIAALNLQLTRLNRQLQQNLTETYHRVKNNLQLVAGLLDVIQTDADTVPRAEVMRMQQHVQAMANIHDLLTQEVKTDAAANGVSAQRLVEKLAPLLQQVIGIRELRLNIQEMRLPASAGGALSILINELVTNAAKHGQGAIELTLSAEAGQGQLMVCDNGPGFPAEFDPSRGAHTGIELVEGMSRLDLRGKQCSRTGKREAPA